MYHTLPEFEINVAHHWLTATHDVARNKHNKPYGQSLVVNM
jgi:hypothetical protein